MKHWYQQPPRSLSAYIKTVLVIEGFTEPVTNELPLVTSGMSALLCKTEKTSDTIENIVQLTLFGKSATEEYLSIEANTTVIIYFFNPFALASIFNVTASKLLKNPVDLAEWSGHKTNAVKTQLVYAGSTSQKIAVLDNLLSYQLQENKRECEVIKYATDQIMYKPDTGILAEIQKKLDLNERTFQRIFKKYVGVTPNHYRRICQFQLSFSQLRSKDFDKLSDVAYESGFADQSHFIRSFREFTQTTPNDYLRTGLKDKND